jgi:hypothetical protein
MLPTMISHKIILIVEDETLVHSRTLAFPAGLEGLRGIHPETAVSNKDPEFPPF